MTVHLGKDGQLATLEGQLDALRAVLWDGLCIDLVDARAFEAQRSGAVPFTLDVRDRMTQPSTEDGDAGEMMGEVSDQAKPKSRSKTESLMRHKLETLIQCRR